MSALIPALFPKQVREAIIECFKANLIPMVRSSPGLGKSSISMQVSDEFKLEYIDFRASHQDVTDFNGLPYFNDGTASYLPFDFFPTEDRELPPGKNGWLLNLDELTSARKEIQAACFKVLTERKMGNRKLHDKVFIMACGNHDSDNAVVINMSTPMQSRLIHIDMISSKDDWIDWALQNNIDSRILAFIEFRPGLLHKFDPQHTDRTFPCPRTWEFVSKLITGKTDLKDRLTLALIAGAISEGTAIEFTDFCEVYHQLPKIADIVANPDTVSIVSEPGTRYALALMVSEQFTDTNYVQLLKFLDRLPIECRIIALRAVRERNPSIIRKPEMAERLQTYVKMVNGVQ